MIKVMISIMLATVLLNNCFAFYNPEIGKFASRDSIEEKGGKNLYGICGNDCINNVDLLGLAEGQTLVALYFPYKGNEFNIGSTLNLLGSIHDNLIWKIKNENLPEDSKRGKQSNRKYDGECWDLIYYIESEISDKDNGTFVLGTSDRFFTRIFPERIKNWIKEEKYVPYDPDFSIKDPDTFYMQFAPYIYTHEVLHATGKYLHLFGEQNKKHIMCHTAQWSWIETQPTISEATKKEIVRTLKVKESK